MRKGRVLVVDDSAAIRREVVETLEAAGDFETPHECADGFAALRMMAEYRPDVVLCDLVMPICDGVHFLRLRAAKPELSNVPVLMLTGAADQDTKVDVLDRGAADYIMKPFHRGELLARVRVHFRLRSLHEELEAANARLEELSCTDGLTGLFNRRHLDRLLDVEVSRHVRYGTALTIMLVDIDHFKGVNDTYGHLVGDAVLREVSQTLKQMTRKADVVCRYGGEEICILLSNTPMAGATILAERLRAAIEALEITSVMRISVKVTASIGIAAADGIGKGCTAEALLANADRALYRAKSEGRNRVIAAPADEASRVVG
ncbi:MAG: diguanylate cyclase [Polyangiaceae bacterium]|nr:diguanylate cyclase [Polyangiaceae bacterium]